MPQTIRNAIVAGVVASLAYTIVAQPVVVALYGSEMFFVPFRQIAAVAVGPSALYPEYDLLTAVGLGAAVHLAVGLVYAVIFWIIVRAASLRSAASLVISGMIYGVLIYALNLYVIFPRFYPWFLENSPLLQVTLHAVPFGAVLGWWLSRDKRAPGVVRA